MRRLRDLEARLRQAGGGIEAAPPQAVELPAAQWVNTPTRPAIARAIAARRAANQQRLAEQGQAGINAFDLARTTRLQALDERIREEKLAELTVRDAAKLKEQRDAVDALTIAELEPLVENKLSARARQEVLLAQLEPGSVFLPPLVDVKMVDRQVEVLAGLTLAEAIPRALAALASGERFDPLALRITAPGIGMRPRLELRRRVVASRIGEINRQILAAIRVGEAEKARLAAESGAEREAEVETILAALAEERGDVAVEEGRASLERVQTLERQMAMLRLAGTGIGGAGGTVSQVGRVRITPEELQAPAGTGSGETVSGKQAISRVAERRAELERWIQAAVSDIARDLAQQHNLDLTLVRGPEELRAAAAQEGSNMTQRFVDWMAPGAKPTIASGAWEGSR